MLYAHFVEFAHLKIGVSVVMESNLHYVIILLVRIPSCLLNTAETVDAYAFIFERIGFLVNAKECSMYLDSTLLALQ